MASTTAISAPPPPSPLPQKGMDLLMCIGCVLIVNSHLEAFYPHPWMAGDGLLGNLIFFFLSGYRVTYGQLRSPQPLFLYYWRRISRIYPSVWWPELIFAPSLLSVNWREWISRLLWPTRFTYVECIIPYYLLLHPVIHFLRRKTTAILWILLLLTYAGLTCLWRPHPQMFSDIPRILHHLLYFSMVVLGCLFIRFDNPSSKWAASLAIPCFCLYLGVKFVVFTTKQYQFIWLVHALGFSVPPLLFVLICRCSPLLETAVMNWPNKITSFVAARTLEIYVIHTFFIDRKWISEIRLPFNIIVLWSITLGLASALLPLATLTRRLIEGKSKR